MIKIKTERISKSTDGMPNNGCIARLSLRFVLFAFLQPTQHYKKNNENANPENKINQRITHDLQVSFILRSNLLDCIGRSQLFAFARATVG